MQILLGLTWKASLSGGSQLTRFSPRLFGLLFVIAVIYAVMQPNLVATTPLSRVLMSSSVPNELAGTAWSTVLFNIPVVFNKDGTGNFVQEGNSGDPATGNWTQNGNLLEWGQNGHRYKRFKWDVLNNGKTLRLIPVTASGQDDGLILCYRP